MKHIVALLLALLMVMPLSLVAGATTTTGTSTLSAFEKQSVRVDLEGSSAGEDKFSMEQYPYVEGDTVADMSIITLMEYGYNTYSAADGRHGDYSLFLYVYNPGNVDVSKRDTRHAITMSIGSSESYSKYPMKLLSYAGDEGHNKLLLKFKVDISAATLRELIGEKADRTYQISEFEIAGTTDTNATTHAGGKWTYSGFQAGYGSKEGTLTCTSVDNFKTIWVNPKAVTYRTPIDYNSTRYEQLDSVYFSLPKEIVEKYGTKIANISYEYYEYDSGWLVGFDDADAYEHWKQKEGIVLEEDDDLAWLDYELRTEPYGNGSPTGNSYLFQYTIPRLIEFYKLQDGNSCDYANSLLSYVFSYDESAEHGEIIDTDVQIFFGEEWRKFCNGETSYIFSDKESHYVKKDMEPNYTLNTYNGNFWDALFGRDDVLSPNKKTAIQIVTEEDLKDVENKLLVDSHYADELKIAYGEAKARGDTLVVFHFAKSEYLTDELHEVVLSGYWESGFVAKETIYMDFDMIEMTFDKEGEYVVLPVAHSPINVVSDLQLPGNDDWPPDWLVWTIVIAIIVVVIVLLVVFAPSVLTAIFQAIWFVLKMIAKGIIFLFRLIIKGIVALCKGIASLFQGSKKKN